MGPAVQNKAWVLLTETVRKELKLILTSVVRMLHPTLKTGRGRGVLNPVVGPRGAEELQSVSRTELRKR